MSSKNSHTLLPQFLLSLVTPTMMVSKMTGEHLVTLLEDMGKASEEMFRGERLPVLKNHYSDLDAE